MFFRSITFAAAVVVGGVLASGCAAPAADDDRIGAADDDFVRRPLRDRVALDRARALGDDGSVLVDYAPAAYAGPTDVAFEAVEYEAAEDDVTISVAGAFPSRANVLVTDASFRVLAAARTQTTADGLEEVSLRAPGGTGGRFVLVRDPAWVLPMTFEVRVATAR